MDTKHVIVKKLPDGAELHRFNNSYGVPYSAVYVGDIEYGSCERAHEEGLIQQWCNEHPDEHTSVVNILEEVVDDICNNYCKWPEKWDEEKEGKELSDSEICDNCPLNKLV